MKIIDWLQQYNKAFVGIVMVIVYLINQKYGIDLPIDDATALSLVGLIISGLTYLIPNKKL